MNFGINEAPDAKSISQPDGYSEEIDEVAGHLAAENDGELVEELADTATIEQLLDTFIQEVSDILALAVEVSLEGNPVRTHLDLVNGGQDIVELAYELRAELVAKVANRAEVIEEQGDQLRKQVIPEGD